MLSAVLRASIYQSDCRCSQAEPPPKSLRVCARSSVTTSEKHNERDIAPVAPRGSHGRAPGPCVALGAVCGRERERGGGRGSCKNGGASRLHLLPTAMCSGGPGVPRSMLPRASLHWRAWGQRGACFRGVFQWQPRVPRGTAKITLFSHFSHSSARGAGE